MPDAPAGRHRVAIVTLGCGRNEVDSDQVGGALSAAGYDVVDDPAGADCVLVNTCTFIAPAREESIEVVLGACDLPARRGRPSRDGRKPVLVIGCMAQRYGAELADALPEAAAVVGFDAYPRIPELVAEALGGAGPRGARPTTAVGGTAAAPPRRSLPLLASAPRATAPERPPTAAFPLRTVPRGPWADLKIAGGCDRVCTFCAIPSFRGRFTSRPLPELEAEARWLVAQGVRELVCVSENTTSWGKDLPGGRAAQVDLVRMFDRVDGLERVRLLYLQPAELQPRLLDAMAESRTVAGYYDLSLQHASGAVLERMARSGSPERFLDLIEGIRRRDPDAALRSSFILGFPGEREEDVDVLEAFVDAAGLDWVGAFTYSREDGTPAATMPDQVPAAEARRRRDRIVDVAERVADERAARFVGRVVDVLVEGHEGDAAVGRSPREAPETDGEVRVAGCGTPVGRIAPALVVGVDGVDLEAVPAGVAR